MVKWGCAVAGLMVGCMPAMAQEAQPQGQGVPAQPVPAQSAQGQSGPGQSEPTPQPPASAAPEDMGEDIVVSGVLPGAVQTDAKPELQLSPADIRAYGASNVTELLAALGPQLGSGSGRGDEQPVILLGGRRSTMNEVRNLPVEAIERVDVLPEEVALQYGYGATQKVINFVLRRRFMGLTTSLGGRTPTDGGNAGGNGEVNLVKVLRDNLLTVNVKYDQNSGILDSERGVNRSGGTLFDTRGNISGLGAGGEIDPALSALAGHPVTVAGVPASAVGAAQPLGAYLAGANMPNITDVSQYRTLVNPQKNLTLSAVYALPVSSSVRATATLDYAVTESKSLLGLPSATLRLPAGNPYSPFGQDVRVLRYYDSLDPLTRNADSQTLRAELNINGEHSPWIKSWRWSFQANYENGSSDSTTTTGVDAVLLQAMLDARDPGFNPFAPVSSALNGSRPDDWTKSTRSTGNVEFLTNGTLLRAPAGDVRASLRVAGRTNDISSSNFRLGTYGGSNISRDSASVRGNINLPIASRNRDVLAALGNLSINGNVEIEEVSDFGRLTTTGYGLNWSPINAVQAIVSFIDDSNAPSPQQLGDARLVTPNVRVYDFLRGESVDITQITGGNPALIADNRHVFRAMLNIRPLTKTQLTFTGTYTNTRWNDQAQRFPGASPELEAAFPDRFVRDASGRLLSVDSRPVNVDRSERSELRWGFSLFLPVPSPAQKRMLERRTAFQKAREESRRTGQPMPPEMTTMLEQFRRLGQQSSLFGSPFQRTQGQGANRPPEQQNQPQDSGREQNREQSQSQPQSDSAGQQQGGQQSGPGGPGGGGGGFGGPRGFGGPGGGPRGPGGGRGGNRLIFTGYHTWVLRDRQVIRAGLPVIDRLSGLGSQAVSAHKVDLTTGITHDAYQLTLTGTWQSATRTVTGLPGDITELRFGDLAKVGLQAQFNPGQDIDWLLKHPFLRGSRIQFNVDNLFNARQRVIDQNGATPAAYVPNRIDPLGRVIRLTFRKQFY